jgi:hypothetical protein
MAFIRGSSDEPLWGNVGAELQKSLPNQGWNPDLSEVGFWGGPAVLGAYKHAMDSLEDQRKAETSREVANIKADSETQDAMVRAALGLLQNRFNLYGRLAEIQSNRELQEAMKRLGFQEKIYGEQQHNARTDKELAQKDKLTQEMMNYRLNNFNVNIPADVAKDWARRENPKYTPQEINQRAVEIMQQAKRGNSTPAAGTPELSSAFLRQGAQEALKSGGIPMTPASFIQNAITQAIPQVAGNDTSEYSPVTLQTVSTQPGDNPLAAATENIAKQNGLRGIGDYTVSPQDRADAATYYSDRSTYNPEASRITGANPMAKNVSDFRFPKDEEGFQAPSAREIYKRVAQEYEHSPIMGYNVVPGRLSLTGKREADQVYPVRSQYQKSGFQTYGPGSPTNNPNPDGIRYNPQLDVNGYPLIDRLADTLSGEGRPQSSGYQAGSFPLKLAPNQPQWTGPTGGYDLAAAARGILSRFRPPDELPQWSL